MTAKTKMVITKQSLLALKQTCLDKLDEDATDRERYLTEYEFENRLRDALRANQNGDMSLEGFAEPTMDVLEAAADRRDRMLDSARDEHDRRTAYQFFEERAFNAIRDEMKVDERNTATEALVADKSKRKADPAPAPPERKPAAASQARSEPQTADKAAPVQPAKPAPTAGPRMTVEVIDREVVPDGNLAQELEEAFARTARPDEVTAARLGAIEAGPSPYSAYDQRVSQAWKQPPPTPPKKKKGRHHDLV